LIYLPSNITKITLVINHQTGFLGFARSFCAVVGAKQTPKEFEQAIH
jgi:hypothetical protein